MPNILVMIPSGEVYDHDCVRWYNHKDVQGNLNHYHNIGDAFVFDSSLKLLNYDRLDVLKIRDVRREDIDRYNAEYDYCFLRGSNYIHGSMEWENAVTVLEQLKIPVLAFGIGAQAPSTGKLQLSDTTKRVLRLIADRSVSLGVRGEFTAEVLWDLGIKNARVVGCPTLYRNNDPDLRIDLPKLDDVRDLVFTLRREVSGSYASDIDRYLSLHHDVIVDLAQRFDVIVSAQGEIEEKKIVFGTPQQRDEAFAQLAHEKWFSGADDPMIRIYRDKLFYSDVVAEYDQLMASQDLVLGYRLHGNLMALANGVPSVYFTYDSRTAEFVDTYRIPAFDVFSGKDFRLEDYWDQSLFERFNRAYHARYRDMTLFLDENGIDHKMGRRHERPRLRNVG
ncbi:MAG: polysaccharide pyruvyl transferase family protein [Magnetospirillum sp.]|nr:polysaccharide pyruvyl transferase family protein [Magnetospirillum sp.]